MIDVAALEKRILPLRIQGRRLFRSREVEFLALLTERRSLRRYLSMKTKAARKSSNIYAVVGSDESAVKSAAAELAAQLTPPDAGDFGVETIDACADNADQAASRIRSAIEALRTLPFFGGGKLVWLKNANFLGDSKLGIRDHAALAREHHAWLG